MYIIKIQDPHYHWLPKYFLCSPGKFCNIVEKTVGFCYTKVGSELGFERIKDWGRSGGKDLGMGGGGSAWIPRHFLGSEIHKHADRNTCFKKWENFSTVLPVKKNLCLLLQIRQALSLHLLSEKAKVSNEISYFQTKLGNSAKPVIFTSFFLVLISLVHIKPNF